MHVALLCFLSSSEEKKAGKQRSANGHTTLTERDGELTFFRPPFAGSCGRHTVFNKLILGAVAISAFYLWRLSVQSAEVGGWWNLIRGKGKEGNVAIKDVSTRSCLFGPQAVTIGAG